MPEEQEQEQPVLPPMKVTAILTIQQEGKDTRIARTVCSDPFIQPAFEQVLLEHLAVAFPDEPRAGVAVLVHALAGYMNKFVEDNPEDQGSKLLATVCDNWLGHEARKFWDSLSPTEKLQHAQALHMLDIPHRQELIDKQMKKKIDEHTEEAS